jgi:V8-like Glu-specific endopeptidase
VKSISLIPIFLLITSNIFCQLTQSSNLKYHPQKLEFISYDSIPVIEMNVFDLKDEIEKESFGSAKDKPFIFAKVFDVEIDIKQNGLLIETNEFKRWVLGVKSKGAYSLNFTFNEYNLPPKAELYIYNSKKTSFMGALTSENNKKEKILPVQPIEGELVFFEYIEPKNVPFSGSLIIGKVGHDYKNIFQLLKDGRFELSGECNVDINCATGNEWQNEKQSVCRLFINNNGFCSGALINNVNNNGTPFLLTANHCISTNNAANNTVYVFNYESPTCNGSDGSVAQSISGATLRSTWSWNSSTNRGSDFTLVELSNTPSSNFQPYYSGWDRSNVAASSSTGIHHPMGDVKKICVENNTLTSTFYDPVTGDTNADHWRIADWDIGVTEGGSSGSPLYNQNKRIVGQLHGGDAECNGLSDNGQPDWYGKFSSSWNGGVTDATRLRSWLDPNNTTVELPGLRFVRDAAINSSTPVSGDIVRFENVNVQNGANINVSFEVRFITSGTFNVPAGSTITIGHN